MLTGADAQLMALRQSVEEARRRITRTVKVLEDGEPRLMATLELKYVLDFILPPRGDH